MKFSELVTDETMTSESDPVEYVGTTSTGKTFFFRYRWGAAWLGLGDNVGEAIKDCREHYWIVEGKDTDSVDLSREEFEETLIMLYDVR